MSVFRVEVWYWTKIIDLWKVTATTVEMWILRRYVKAMDRKKTGKVVLELTHCRAHLGHGHCGNDVVLRER